jgi:hypothetical protein
MFKSALYPDLLSFHVEATINPDNGTNYSSKHQQFSKKSITTTTTATQHDDGHFTYKVIGKSDDLLQDQ